MAKRGRPAKSNPLTARLTALREELENHVGGSVASSGRVPEIMEFIESPDYLGLSHYEPTPIELFPFQKIALKVFYRGTKGNENLRLTDDEIQLCRDHGLDDPDFEQGDLLKKYESGNLFQELVLVWGRRSGKDFVISILALYEAMRLIETPGGDPHALYGLSTGAPFTIITIANSSKQAEILFQEMKDKVLKSAYFSDKISPEGILQDTMFIMTPADRRRNEEMKARGLPTSPGSVVIRAGHSNSDTLAGIGCYCLMLDEIGLYKQTPGSSGGEAIYRTLAPATATYVRMEKYIDEAGVERDKHIYDGKIICISSPRGKEGVLYDLFRTSPTVPQRLSLRLPTWVVNTRQSHDGLRNMFSQMHDDEFNMEFGAEFAGTAGQSFFPRDVVEDCFKANIQLKEYGDPGQFYFCHLDPATSSHNYALVVCHREQYIKKNTGKSDFKVVIDHIKFWQPSKDKPIVNEEIEAYIKNLSRRFYFSQVSFDQWNSASSIRALQAVGIPAKLTRFTKRHKIIIYDYLYDLASSGRLHMPHHELLKNEMLYLQRKYMPTGYRVFPKRDGSIKTDDIVDALAGACFATSEREETRLPQGRLARLSVTMGADQTVWRSMQGTPYGVGPGEKISKDMDRRLGR
jgi:hypothetical protein